MVLERPLISGDCLIGSACGNLHLAKLDQGIWSLWIQLRGLLKCRFGGAQVILVLEQGGAKQIVKITVVW